MNPGVELLTAEPVLLVGRDDREGDFSTEGPVWHEEGFVTFTRFRLGDGEIVQWDILREEGSIFRRKSGNANGCALDTYGRLYMCEGGKRRVTRLERDGSLTVVAQSWNGCRLNRPSDLVAHTNGSVYFTDPQALVPLAERELDFAGIFRVEDDGRVQLATPECEYPNGLALSPDESVMYVAISRRDERCLTEVARGEICQHRLLRAFDVQSDGSLVNNRVFAEMSGEDSGAPDGVAVDGIGRVYCTGPGGIWVLDSFGNHLSTICLPEVPRNMVFGGPDLNLLFVTAGDSLYLVATNTQGIAWRIITQDER